VIDDMKRLKRGDFDFDWDDICTFGNFYIFTNYQGNKKCTYTIHTLNVNMQILFCLLLHDL